MTTETATETPPKVNPDPARVVTCAHGFTAKPRRVRPAFRGHGWWQNYAADCKSCNGNPSGLPYKPA